MKTLIHVRAARVAALFLLGCSATPAAGTTEWMLGAGVASVSYPAYRGAQQRRSLTVPVPVFSFWSENWQIGRGGAQLELGDTGNLRLRLSANGSLPVDSDDNGPREGLPDLNPSFEFGPALTATFPFGRHFLLQPELLVRGVVATDLRQFDAIGWVVQPRMTLRFEREAPGSSIETRFSVGPVIATQRYHGYYYDVPAQAATETRPAFDASGGFSGWRYAAGLAWTWKRLGVYSYLSYDNIGNAVFADSPLVVDSDYLLGGLMLSWQLASSETR